jgi:hypothetical protein
MRLDHAHCDPLELAAEAGLPAAAAVALGLGAALAFALARARRAPGATLACGLFAGLAAAAAHALVDFDLQLEGSLAFAALVAGLLAGAGAPALRLEGAPARALALAGLAGALALAPYPARVFWAERIAHPSIRAKDDARPAGERAEALERAIALRPAKVDYLLEAAECRAEAFADAIDRAADAAARGIAGDRAPSERVRLALRRAITGRRLAEEAEVAGRSLADLRAARRLAPEDPRVLAAIARFTNDRDEALAASGAALRGAPFAADLLVDLAIARLRFDRADADALGWLTRGLALDPRLVERAVRLAAAIGAEEAIAGAVPDRAEPLHALAAALGGVGRLDLAARALDRLAAVEERGVAAEPSPLAIAAQPALEQAIRPGDWLDAPGGKPLEALRAPALRLRRRSAFAQLRAPGRLAIDAALWSGASETLVCVLLDGRHLGHVLVGDAWGPSEFDVGAPGWLELALAGERHGIALEGAPTVLVRAAAVREARAGAGEKAHE